MRKTINSLLAMVVLCTLPLGAQEDKKEKKEKPAKQEEKKKDPMDTTNWRQWNPDPAPVYSAEESLQMFKIAPGFRIELVAAAPLIKDPVFAEWDMEGRLWVCEFQSYMRDAKGSDENSVFSRVVVLEDTDDDGRMDKSTPFLEGVINPRSLSIVKGGALVALGSGSLIFAEDRDGDLVSEKQTPLIEFAKAARGNIEHAENAMHFAIDNWMYNSKSKRRLWWQDEKLSVTETKSRGQWGMSTDEFGRLYYNTNSRWFSTDSEIYDRRFGAPGAPHGLIRAIRTNTALNRAYKPGMIKKDGRIAGVTSISGLAVHSSGAFGTDWEGAIFSFSPGCNAVGAFKLKAPMPQAKPSYEHVLLEDEDWQQREFLASTDERFRPVNGSFGPDGCLTIVDFYRGIIQHKKFLTSYLRRQSVERELDQHIGDGRIWRVVPENVEPVAKPESLVAGLSHPMLWWRLASQKRIVQSSMDELVPELLELAVDGSVEGRVHAMWALAGLGKLENETVKKNLAHKHWFVSMTALRLAGETTSQSHLFPPQMTEEVVALSERKEPVLRHYANEVVSKGYPDRFASVYKEKMPKHVKSEKALKSQWEKGQKIYGQFCAACHQPNGKGLTMVAPTLVDSDWVTDEDRLIRVALHGVQGPIEINGKPVEKVAPIMPGHGFIADEDMANVLTFVRNAWGNASDAISKDDVKQVRGAHSGRVLPWTQAELEDALK